MLLRGDMVRRSRGRPKLNKPAKDLGTVELQKKKKLHITDDALDLMLRREVITENQYHAGMKLRYFFNMLYGFLKVRAYDMSMVRGLSTDTDGNEVICAKIKQRYDGVMRRLASRSYSNTIYRVCLHGEMQPFMQNFNIVADICDAGIISQIEQFQNAMQFLETEMDIIYNKQ